MPPRSFGKTQQLLRVGDRAAQPIINQKAAAAATAAAAALAAAKAATAAVVAARTAAPDLEPLTPPPPHPRTSIPSLGFVLGAPVVLDGPDGTTVVRPQVDNGRAGAGIKMPKRPKRT